MNLRGIVSCLFFSSIAVSCMDADSADAFYVISQVDEFDDGTHEWDGDFAEYPIEDSLLFELKFGHEVLPSGSAKALVLSGNNLNKDLFMFLKKRIRYLQPNTEYTVSFDISFVTNAPKGSAGAEGSPGENVFLKAGATAIEPVKVAEGGAYKMNIDIGNQNLSGASMTILGDIATSSGTDSYSLETRNSLSSFKVTSNNNGELWLIVGTDSGFKGTTTLYYTRIGAVLSIVN